MKRIGMIFGVYLAVGAAMAKDNVQPAPASPDKAQAMEKPAASEKPSVAETKPAPEMSKKAYLRLLAASLRQHSPRSTQHHAGSVKVAFTVGASGRVVSHKIKQASDPALAATVGKILAAVHTPPPPGGSFVAVQEFTFH